MKEEIINADERGNLLAVESTTNYGLIKPGQDDFYNVDEFNQNMDTIDQQLKVNENQINVLYTNGFNGEYRHYDGDLTDLNDFTTLGKFEIVKDLSTIKNLPVNTSGLVRFSIVVEKRISNVYRQEIHFKSTPFFNRSFYRDTLDNGDWGEWAEVATTTKTDISFPYNSGFKDESSTWISFIEQGSIYTRVVLNLTGSNGTVPKGSSQIATLPVGSRPIKNMSIVLGTSDASKFCKGVIYATGVIAINNPHDGLTYVEGSAIF